VKLSVPACADAAANANTTSRTAANRLRCVFKVDTPCGDPQRTHGFGRMSHITCQSYNLMVMDSFDVLAEPTRRRILDLLLERSRPVGELVERLGTTQPGMSKHLRVLREAGLVSVRRDGQRRRYELRPEPLADIDAWLEPYRRQWAARLDALERHLGKEAPR